MPGGYENVFSYPLFVFSYPLFVFSYPLFVFSYPLFIFSYPVGHRKWKLCILCTVMRGYLAVPSLITNPKRGNFFCAVC